MLPPKHAVTLFQSIGLTSTTIRSQVPASLLRVTVASALGSMAGQRVWV